MTAPTLNIAPVFNFGFSLKKDVLEKVMLFAAILACINLAAFS